MAKKGYVGIWISLIVAVFAMVGCQFGEDVYDDPQEEAGKATVQQDLGVTCGVLRDCQPYDVCIKNGSAQCISNRCKSVQTAAGIVDLQCVIDVYTGLSGAPPSTSSTSGTTSTPTTSTTSTAICGRVDPPVQEVAKYNGFDKHANCDRATEAWAGRMLAEVKEARAWVDVVADTPGSTIEVLELTLYGVLSNGQSVVVRRTTKGQPAITWIAEFSRDEWFVPTTPLSTTPPLKPLSSDVYSVPLNPRLIHFGNGAAPIGQYVDFYVVGVFRTTGTAKVKVGADAYYPSYANGTDHYGWEIGNSHWYSCTSGTITVVSYNPTLADPCSNQIGVVSTTSTTTTTTTTSNGCPSTGIKVTPGSSLISSCASDLRLVTWDNAGNTIRSPSDDAPLVTTPNFLGFLAVTSTCGGAYRTSWPSVGSSAVSAGFSQVCSQGQDVTSTSVICNDGNGSKLSIAINPKESTGRCL